MKLKITLLSVFFLACLASCEVDEKEVFGLDKVVPVALEVKSESREITISKKTWDTTYVIDLTTEKSYQDYGNKVKGLTLKGVNYTVSKFEGDGFVKGGTVEVRLGEQEPTSNPHDSFADDLKTKKMYSIKDPVKITKAQELLDKEKKINIKILITLDKVPEKPIKAGLDFKLDVELKVDLSNAI